jgi:hypothetical protein
LQHTIALRAEFDYHYLSQVEVPSTESLPASLKQEELTEQKKQDREKKKEDDRLLRGYQHLCREVGKPIADSIDECRMTLKLAPYINIVDLIDSRRTGSQMSTFDHFGDFKKYTLRVPGKRIKQEFAIADMFLSGLLQNFRKGPVRDCDPVLRENGPRANGIKRRREGDHGGRTSKAIKVEA